MKVSKLTLLALPLAALMIAASGKVQAQGSTAPSGQIGLGVYTYGAGVLYAISPGIIVGGLINFSSTTINSNSTSNYEIQPFVRLLLEGTVNPFFHVGLAFGKGLSVVGTNESYIHLRGGAGLEYFITRNVGAIAGLTIIQIGLDPSSTSFGISGGMAGVEWFFNR